MTPVRTVRNHYRGVNAHLHSLWQSAGGWNNFHNPHIAALVVALKARLLPMGYTASIEESVQIRRAFDVPRFPRADVSIMDLVEQRPPYSAGAAGLSGVVVSLRAVLADDALSETPYHAIAIVPLSNAGQPVVWMEVLSPSNKRGDDALTYQRKRADLLEAGIVFVELDYLDQLPPSTPKLPDYSRLRAAPAHPYRILVFDPRPELERGHASLNEFDVDDPIPGVTIPLNGDDVLRFDFNAPYQKQYAEMLYGLENVDYAEFPHHFDHYSHDDQARIARRMVAVLAAAKRGDDLEQPLEADPALTLDAALAQLSSLRVER